MTTENRVGSNFLGRGPLSEVWGIAWPTVLTMTSYTVMQFIDKLMVGQVGPLEVAAQGNGGIWAKDFGESDPRLASSLNNLAALYYTQGKYEEAEPLYQRALAIDEKALGPEYPDTASIRENYADLLRKTERR